MNYLQKCVQRVIQKIGLNANTIEITQIDFGIKYGYL